ncbi:MAG: hypothetical protein MK207_09815 [Saprospiraceae bacterium]|nr:hypothetical protein [Saprospiraceae bacterium]
MKNLLINLGFLLFIWSISSCSTKQRIVGNWKIETKDTTFERSYFFKKNGTLEIAFSKENTEINNWEYSKKKKVITISEKDNIISEHFVINYISPLFLGLSNKDNGFVLTRNLKIKSINHNKARKKLRGEWSIVQIEDSCYNYNEKNLTFHFFKNSSYREKVNEKVRLGRWVLNDNNTKLTLSNDNNTQTIDINFLKKNKLQFTDQYGSYILEKTNNESKAPSNQQIEHKIIGAWALANVGDKEVGSSDYTLYLNEDGSLKIFEDQHISQVGQWYVSEDAAFLVFEHSLGRLSYPIENISRKSLELIDDFQTILFNRIQN